jgi:hypothetical protein
MTAANEMKKNGKQNKTKGDLIKNDKIFFTIENAIFGWL